MNQRLLNYPVWVTESGEIIKEKKKRKSREEANLRSENK